MEPWKVNMLYSVIISNTSSSNAFLHSKAISVSLELLLEELNNLLFGHCSGNMSIRVTVFSYFNKTSKGQDFRDIPML